MPEPGRTEAAKRFAAIDREHDEWEREHLRLLAEVRAERARVQSTVRWRARHALWRYLGI